jgi:hypothetical protein
MCEKGTTGGDLKTVVYKYDSVRVLFGNDKELWFRADKDEPYAICNSDNYSYKNVGKRKVEKTYVFSDAQLNLATDVP